MSDDAPRNLTDADIAALGHAIVEPVAALIKAQLVEDFQLEIGRGVIAWARRAIFGILFALAIWGASHFYTVTDTAPHQH